MAQKNQQDELAETSLLATDQMRSVLQLLKSNRPCPNAYSPYGHRPMGNGLLSLLGFNGERSDPITGHYLLGNGYRAFNPVLMRFMSPDNLSPFGKGGLNPYAYCIGDPVNRYDDSGHWPKFLQNILKSLRKNPVPSHPVQPSPAGSRKFTLYENLYAQEGDEIYNQKAFNSYQKKPKFTNERYKVPPKKIELSKDLESIPDSKDLRIHARRFDGEFEVTFILNERKELFVSSLKHAHLSALTNSRKLISAGTITRTGANSFDISNSSGNFKPAFHSLIPVEKFLTGLGADVTSIRHQGW